MKTILAKLVVPALLLGAIIGPVSADPANPPHNINHRLTHQQQRINQGIRSGGLTPRETRNVEARERRIRNSDMRDRMHNGGHLTAANRRHIERRLNGASRAIYNKKHNAHTM